ncbi:hypothetical protein SDC9_163391 [bioreactor metagenome]|uniref:Uncharacterized protein n=1 Tax=bioreactor metagenome TaxID=1076179 RepID=A0A645FVF4_9ZZZZ
MPKDLTLANALQTLALGNGLIILILTRPALMPSARLRSTASLAAPDIEPVVTIAYSASSILYSSIAPSYVLPNNSPYALSTSSITLRAFCCAFKCLYLYSIKRSPFVRGSTAIGLSGSSKICSGLYVPKNPSTFSCSGIKTFSVICER